MAVTLTSRFPEIAAEIQPLVGEALREGAKRIEAEAKLRVPVATGQLRDAIHVERRSAIRYEVKAGDSEAWYGHLVEFGTAASAGGPNKRAHAATAAQPFLIPAFEEALVPTVESVTTALRGL